MRRIAPLPLLLLLVAVVVPGTATAHPERTSVFPDHTKGKRPQLRSSGTARVVCKPDSARRIRRAFRGKRRAAQRDKRLALLKRCRYRHIQAAVNASRSRNRVLVMPGVYREEPSRRVPYNDPKCSGDGYWEPTGDGHGDNGQVPTYRFQHDCPNSRNLIAIIGDSLADRDLSCDRRCGLQIQGMGRRPSDVLVVGDRLKKDVFRADRADGVVIHNLAAEQAAFNNFDVVETNGFRLSRLVGRWGQNYGILTFASDNGLYERITAYGNGDSGIYPGSGPEGHCKRYGIEIRRVNSYGNVLGYSGTAGNGTSTHDSKFHHNSAGISDDSFASGHPGMPQDCSKWTRNEINSNNVNYFQRNRAECLKPFQNRRRALVCPQFQVPVGSGIILYGANRNRVSQNRIWDNWRSGVRLFWVPASIRGDADPAKQYDTSNGNRFTRNVMGVAPSSKRDPNGEDFFWDEQGFRNCWEGNRAAKGRRITSDPAKLPTCASGGSRSRDSNINKSIAEVPCGSWNPRTNPDPPGCTWFKTPPEPRR